MEDSTGLPGDHFSLEGAVELFKQAESPEDFEKRLNSEDAHVTNLDLNEDGETDYLRVVDNLDGEAHALVIQAVIGPSESQDVAVIEIEKQGEDNAILQIVGDEDIFGEQVIVEPFEEEKGSGKGRGPNFDEAPFARIVVNVWVWPSVRFMYRPGYTLWVSPWAWARYPGWWRPWRPHPFRHFHLAVMPWRRHCHVTTTHRVVHAHRVYAPRRTHSTVVHTRTSTVVKARGPHGGAVVGKKTTTTTAVRGKHGGGAVHKKSTTKVKRSRKN
jgi:hypothetical protein